MRVSELSRFPHPVLSTYSKDFTSGEFDVVIEIEERLGTGALRVQHKVTLTEPTVQRLVESGEATVGMFVHCDDTYYRDLIPLAWPAGHTDFEPGELLNRVSIRSFVWLDKPLVKWSPGGIHEEFPTPLSLNCGDVIAIGSERVFSVGQAKLAKLETIFELKKGVDLKEGEIVVDLENELIMIYADPKTFETITQLRGQEALRAALLNGVYLPAVMEVLTMVRSEVGLYQEKRWFKAFQAKCDSMPMSIILGLGTSSALTDAQRLLNYPIKQLSLLLAVNHGDE